MYRGSHVSLGKDTAVCFLKSRAQVTVSITFMLTSRSLPPESLRSQMGGRKSLETCWEEQAGPRGPVWDAAAPLPDLSGGKKWGLFVCGHTCGCEGPQRSRVLSHLCAHMPQAGRSVMGPVWPEPPEAQGVRETTIGLFLNASRPRHHSKGPGTELDDIWLGRESSQD